MKKVELKNNTAGGVDLLTEKDCGNEVLISTGKSEKSLEFWKALRVKCDVAITAVEETIKNNK